MAGLQRWLTFQSRFNRSDVDLAHPHHGVERTLGRRGMRIGYHQRQIVFLLIILFRRLTANRMDRFDDALLIFALRQHHLAGIGRTPGSAGIADAIIHGFFASDAQGIAPSQAALAGSGYRFCVAV